jgi:hypothetical protein
MTDTDKRTKTERIQDEDGFGFEITWSYSDHFAQFEVRKLAVSGDGTPRGWVAEPVDQVYASGFVKWDSCSELRLHDQEHWCGWKHWTEHMGLLGHLFITAFDLMAREPEDAEGRATYRAAVAAREADRRLARYVERCRELDNFPADPAKRGVIEEVRLHQLVAELDDLYRALTPEQQQQVDAPGAKLARARN